jgi:hypothetical protein
MAATFGKQAYTIKEVGGSLAVVHVESGRVVFDISITGIDFDLRSGGSAKGSAEFAISEPSRKGQ